MITVVNNIAKCAEAWRLPNDGWRLLQDWEFRHQLAVAAGIEPFFIVDTESGTILPAGRRNDALQFYGGIHYNERNRFIGPSGGEARILDYLRDKGMRFRLLSWSHDPKPHLPTSCLGWDVPYNQYWELREPISFESHLQLLPPDNMREAQYLGRKFTVSAVPDEQLLTSIDSFIDHTIASFAKRSARCAYSDAGYRETTLRVAEFFLRRKLLRGVIVNYRGVDVGLGVLILDAGNHEAVYLLNLYRQSPSDSSNGVTLAVLQFACTAQVRVDALRGAFALKPKYGYRPAPSYAVVNDPGWKLMPQKDLTQETLLRLYGRPFGVEDGKLSIGENRT